MGKKRRSITVMLRGGGTISGWLVEDQDPNYLVIDCDQQSGPTTRWAIPLKAVDATGENYEPK